MTILKAGDVRNTIRGLTRTPTISLSAIICLTLGIGVTVALWSAVSSVLIQPLPFESPDRLVAVHRVTPQSGPLGTWAQSPPNYTDIAHATRQLSGLAAVTPGTALTETPSGSEQVSQLYITGNLFDVLGAKAARGRLLKPIDDDLAQPNVAVISNELWQTKFGGDPSVVNRKIIIDGAPTTIIGILPPRFEVPQGPNVFRADVWSPIRFTPQQLQQRRSNYLILLGRLAPGATIASAHSELRGIFARLAAEYPKLRGEDVRVAELAADSRRGVRKPLLLLFGAVCLVLLIAVTNVAALLLARGVQRRRELAVRNALGATRWDAMRPMLLESFAISIIGTVGGLVVALLNIRTIGALSASQLPQLNGLGIDHRVMLFAITLCVVVAVLCGLVPAWRGASVDPQEALRGGRGGGAGRDQHRALRTLVTIEIALSVVLLIGGGLVLSSFRGLLSTDPGFEVDHVLTLRLAVPAANFANGDAVRRVLEPALAAIRALPNVEAAGSINLVPFLAWGNNSNIRYESDAPRDPTTFPKAENRSVDPQFFTVTKQRLLAGRLLSAADDERPESTPVVVVNQALVDRDFKAGNPIGRRFYTTDTTFATIVGVVSNIRNMGPFKPTEPEMYYTYRQSAINTSNFPLMIRVKGDNPNAALPAIRAAITQTTPLAAISSTQTMNDVIATSLGGPHFYVLMLGSFAGVALVLALAGLFGVLSYTVAQRSRELGIRSALGGTSSDLVRLMMWQGLRMIVVGLAVGYVGAVAASQLMTSILYGASTLNPMVWVGAGVALLATGALATFIPARRAADANPMVAIRAE